MLIDLRPKNITGADADAALIKADITVNKNMVPFDDQPTNGNLRNTCWNASNHY